MLEEEGQYDCKPVTETWLMEMEKDRGPVERDWVPSYLQGETKEKFKQKREFVALFRYAGDIFKGANFGVGRKR